MLTKENHHDRLLQQEIQQFESITLSEIKEAALLDRVDTKYMMGVDQLTAILPQVSPFYRALTINNIRLHAYETLYFDTNDFSFYEQHHNGVSPRFKVRERKYVDTDLTFLEVKHRTNQRRTIKSRLPINDVAMNLNDQLTEFASEHVHCETNPLESKLWNDYQRMTLVSKDQPERVTIDVNLKYRWQDAYAELPGLVIVEVKQAKQSQSSPFITQMRQLGIRSTSYSKYVAGVYSLYQGVKTNNFKPQMRMVNKVMKGVANHGYAS